MRNSLFQRILLVVALAGLAGVAQAADKAVQATTLEQTQPEDQAQSNRTDDSNHDTYAMLLGSLVLMGSIALRRSHNGK